MLYDLTVKISVPGQDKDSAVEWLVRKIPHVTFEVIEASPSENQPAPITGTGNITLPLNIVHGN